MERFPSQPFTAESYETFSSDDSRYDSPFDRCLSAEWHECEAVEVEYACPQAATLIDSMNEYWTPRDLHQLASDLKAHSATCPVCRGERKPVESQQMAIEPAGMLRMA